MKIENSNDKWVTLIGLGILLIEQWVGPGGIQLPLDAADLLKIFHGTVSIVVLWLMMLWIVKKVRNRYPAIDQSGKRILVTCAGCLLVMYVLNLVVFATNKLMVPQNDMALDITSLIRYLAGVATMVWIILGMYEAGYYHHLLRQGQKEKNELLYLQMQHQLDALKHKVNPHFLFNSLNTLSYLVHEDAAKAEKFVEELSTVYRYLLRRTDEQMTTLQNEYNFVQSYIILIKIRFGAGLQTTLAVHPDLMQHLLPPLSLQVLVENVVKHNHVSAERPLYVSITTEDEKLVIKNNLQRKLQVIAAGQTGLNYIISKYAQEGNQQVEVLETEDHFIVRLPLLSPLPASPDRAGAYPWIQKEVGYA